MHKHETDGVALCIQGASCFYERSFCFMQKTGFFLVNIEMHRDLAGVVLGRFNTAFMYTEQRTPATSNAAERFLWLLHGVQSWCVM